MKLIRLISVALSIALLTAGALAAQIPVKRTSPDQVVAQAPRLLVANPYTFAPQDSGAAVKVGTAMRLRMEKVVGTNYFVIPREKINEALAQYGIPPDAIFPTPQQRTLASSLQARAMVSTALTKAEGGRYSVTARLAGLSDSAGNTFVVAQEAGQSLDAFGTAAADAFAPAIKSLNDSRECINQRTAAAEKAQSAAKKALAAMPTSGVANFCLALLAMDRKTKADTAEAVKDLQAAVTGDQLSLAAWTLLASVYEARGDTTHTVDALKQMLVVAPTNQPLRELAFKLFIKYEHPEAAEQAALDGLKLDPTNADLWDLLSNARVYKSDYKGAVDALEQVAINDSAKADSSFLLKITVMASQQPDTVRLLKWARLGVNKYPANAGLIQQLLTAYTLAGPLDSAVSVAKRLMAVDSTQVPAALSIAQQLIAAKRGQEAAPFLAYASAKGDATAKENVAALTLNGALALIKDQPDTAVAMLRTVIPNASPTGKVAPIANFYLGVLVMGQVQKIDAETEKGKSCDLANKEQGLLAEAEKALQGSTTYKPEDAAKYLKYVEGYKPRVASMLKAYCKP
ncbi:MAG: hypothetical protein ABJC74_08645 [Gemmatimonadota bacterium]